MPYKNIHFIKVKMELLEDHRFLFELNDTQKGLYILLLALAGKTNNKICDDMVFIKGRLNLKDIEHKDLERISKVFPKFILVNGFWEFKNFNEEHNQILGISQGYPKDTQRMAQNRIEENRKEKSNSTFKPPSEEETIEHFEKKLNSTKEQALRFYNFYGSKDWMVGRNRMKNWHLAATRSLDWVQNKVEAKKGTNEPRPFPKDA